MIRLIDVGLDRYQITRGKGRGERPGIRRKEGRSDAHRFVISVQFAAIDVGAAF